MKTKVIIAALFVSLSTMGFDCINDGFEIAINLESLNGCYYVNSGSSHDYDKSTAPINTTDLYNSGYELTGVGLYDIQIQTFGTDLGTVTAGHVYVSVVGEPLLQNKQLATYSGSWSDFNTPRSIINSPTLVQPDTGGIRILVQAVQNRQTVVLRGVGHVQNVPPTSTESQVCVNAFVQAIAKP